MPEARTSLEIEIRTLLRDQGLTATEDQLKRVMERTQELRHATERNTSSTGAATEEQKAHAQELVRQIEATEKAAAAKKRAGDAAAGLGKEIGQLRLAGQGLSKVFNGLAQGDLAGLIRAGQGLTEVWRAMSIGLGSVMRTLLALSPIIAVVGAGIAAMRKIAADNAEAMQRMWADAKAGGEAYRDSLAALQATNKATFDSIRADIQATVADLDRLSADMARAEKHARAVSAARKEAALAGAGTPEERAEIERRFAADEIQSGIDNAALRSGNIDRRATEARAAVSSADAAVSAAKQKRDEAAANAEAVKYTTDRNYRRIPNTSREAIVARQNALAADKAYQEAIASRDEVARQASQIEQRAFEASYDATSQREVGAIRLDTLSRTPVRPTARAQAEKPFDVGAGRTRAESLDQRLADLGGQLQASRGTEANFISAEFSSVAAERDALYKEIGKALEMERSSTRKLDSQLKSSRQNSTGGG